MLKVQPVAISCINLSLSIIQSNSFAEDAHKLESSAWQFMCGRENGPFGIADRACESMQFNVYQYKDKFNRQQTDNMFLLFSR